MDERGKGNKPGKIRLSPLDSHSTTAGDSEIHSDQSSLQNLCSSFEGLDNILDLEERFKNVNSRTCMCSGSQNEGELLGHFEASTRLCSSVRKIEEGIQECLRLALVKDCLVRLQNSYGLITELEKTMEAYLAYLKELRSRGPEKMKEFVFKGEHFHELCQTAKAHLTFWLVFRERFSAEPRLRLSLLGIQDHLRSIHVALARVIGSLTAWLGSILFCVLQIAHRQQWRLSKNLHRDISTAIEDFNRLQEYNNSVLHDSGIVCNLDEVESCGDALICDRFGICASCSTQRQTQNRFICSISLDKLLNEIANERAYTLAGLVSELLCQHKEISRTLEHDLASNFGWEGFNVAASHNNSQKMSRVQSSSNGVITVLGRSHMPLVKLHQDSPIITFDSLEHKFIGQLMIQLAMSTTLMLSYGADKNLYMHRSLPQQGLYIGSPPDDGEEGHGTNTHSEQEAGHGILKHSASVMSARLSKRVQWHDSLDIDSKAQLSLHYMDMLWTNFGLALCSVLEELRCRGVQQACTLGPLPLWSDSAMMVAVSLLESLHMSGALPPSGSASLRLVSRHIHSMASVSSWDSGFCNLLGTSLKDKCTVNKAPKPGHVTVQSVQKIVALFLPLKSVFDSTHYWKHHPQTDNSSGILRSHSMTLMPFVSRLQTLLSFSTYWIDSKLYHLLSSWSLPPFFMLLHWDTPLLVEAASRAVRAVKPLCFGQAGDSSWGSLPILLEELQGAVLMLESISKKYVALFTEDLGKMCQEFFQEVMPVGRSWKKNRHSGVPCEPNAYAEHAVMQMLDPVFSSTAMLRSESQTSLMTLATVTMMESWSNHILKAEIVFSYYGAQQLQLDFSFVQYWIASDASGLDEETKTHLLSLDVFRHLDAAIHLLMLQPKKKKPMDELDDELESNVSAVSTSSVLSSFSGVDTDTFLTDVLMDKTIPHKQKWLDLRLRGGKSRKGLLPFCLKVQETE